MRYMRRNSLMNTTRLFHVNRMRRTCSGWHCYQASKARFASESNSRLRPYVEKAAAAVAATAFWPNVPAVTAPAAVALVGMVAVMAWTPRTPVSYLLAALAGWAAGAAADVDQPRWQDLIGMGATVLIATFWLLAASDNLNRSGRLPTFWPIARRVLGSWVTAMALLLTALALIGKKV